MLNGIIGFMAFLIVLQATPNTASPVLIQSWKRGKRQIEEKQFDIVVTRAKRSTSFSIRDNRGNKKYKLIVHPIAGNGASVELLPKSGFSCFSSPEQCINLLKPSNDPYQDSFGPEDAISWFSPECDKLISGTAIPRCVAPLFSKKRVVQVESFYVILQALSFEKAPNNPDDIVSITLSIQFSNHYEPQPGNR